MQGGQADNARLPPALCSLPRPLLPASLAPSLARTDFKDYDTDGNQGIDKKEFMALMESTGAFDDM
jgi:hypothetical protein